MLLEKHFSKIGMPCSGGGGEDQLVAADPPHGVLGPLDARLETCAVTLELLNEFNNSAQ